MPPVGTSASLSWGVAGSRPWGWRSRRRGRTESRAAPLLGTRRTSGRPGRAGRCEVPCFSAHTEGRPRAGPHAGGRSGAPTHLRTLQRWGQGVRGRAGCGKAQEGPRGGVEGPGARGRRAPTARGITCRESRHWACHACDSLHTAGGRGGWRVTPACTLACGTGTAAEAGDKLMGLLNCCQGLAAGPVATRVLLV